jgi:hypothetical protein
VLGNYNKHNLQRTFDSNNEWLIFSSSPTSSSSSWLYVFTFFVQVLEHKFYSRVVRTVNSLTNC